MRMKKLYFLIACFGIWHYSFAQTLINPITGGGFDLGNTFAANGWNFVNSSANKWVVGTAASAFPPSAPNTAYVSVDGNTANYSYDNTATHISHFYQQVTIPPNAINVVLSFQLQGNAEFDWGNFIFHDGLWISADPTLTVPTADALPGGGAYLQWFQFDPNVTYIGQTVNLNGLAGQTVFIVFSWVNDDDNVGDNPPASVDQVSLTYCLQSIDYNVTGGGPFCTGSDGVHVGLSGSVAGIIYQLYNNGNPIGSPITGTGSPIDFGLQNTVGTYTVIGSFGTCTYPMPGSVDVTENPLPGASAGNNSPVCSGSTLSLSSSGGSTFSWTGPNSFTSSAQSPTINNVTTAASGTYTVTVTDVNGCSAQATTAATITPLDAATLTSAPGTDAESVCINTAITDIKYFTTGATGATFSNLPPGVSGSWSGNNITISGTPTSSGLFNYSINLLGGCPVTITGSINVVDQNSITLSSATGTDAQTTCINSPIIDITYNTTGATGATFSNLPPGVTGSWAANVVTISGTPTSSAASPYNYTVTLTGGCSIASASGSVTVIPAGTVTLSSGAGTDAQTLCTNTPLANIIYTTTGATGATFNGLPPGVTGSWSANTVTISGTPNTSVGSPFSYTVSLTGVCGNNTASGTITVTPKNTITLSSAAGTDAQTVCANSVITDIAYATTGATGATFIGLPPGVNGSFTANTVTISGTPSSSAGSPYNYTVTLTGGCGTISSNGSITVTPANIITLTSAIGTDAQTVCINSAITNITYTTTGATGATFSGLPAGVTGTWSANTITITGSPTSSAGSPYNYVITLTGGCGSVIATGQIVVAPVASVTLTSAAGTNTQYVCSGSSITNITYLISNGTGFMVNGLPTGLTVTPGIGTFTISGSPTQTGVFPYLVTITGGCTPATASGTVTVNAQSIALTSGTASPTVCNDAPMANIVYTIGGTANNASVSGLPAGVTGTISGNNFTISGTPSDMAGDYIYTVTTSGTGCTPASLSGTITISPPAVGGSVGSVSICSGGSGTVMLTGQDGNIVGWEYSTDGGSTWISITNTSSTQSFTNVTVPTQYRAVVNKGCSDVYSTAATVEIHNYWVGSVSTNWNTAANWSDGNVPSLGCYDVYIPNQTNQPLLSAAPVATIGNLHILAGAIVTINGSGYMQIAGTISSANNFDFDVTQGSLEFNGSSQSVDGSTFIARSIKDLIVSSSGTGLAVANTVGDTLNITDALTFGNATADLNTGGNITLKSTISATASLGQLASGNVITGDVTVERYVATGNTGGLSHAKSWQLLAIPTQGQTINQAWQEGATVSDVVSPTAPSAGNPNAGYGAMITSDVAGTPQGFDAQTAAGTGASMKVYNAATGGYTGVPNTTATQIYNQKGYFVFVRGDRSIVNPFAAANPTTLRTRGILFTPANTPPATTVAPGQFESVGNPYAAPIDMRKFIISGGTEPNFIVWDPRLGSYNGYGAFQTLTLLGTDYYAVPGGGSYGSGPVNFIQSGQAFFIQALAGGPTGSISFNESVKASGSALFTTPNPVPSAPLASLRSSLYSGSTLLDGVLQVFKQDYSNNLDNLDARKMINSGANLAIRHNNTLLAVERRAPLSASDTIFLNISGLGAATYQFHFDAQNLDPALQAVLLDTYLGTRTPVNMTGTTDISFTISNAASNTATRFMILFSPAEALPLTFTSVKAFLQDQNIDVQWRTQNEMNVKNYIVEKSLDGNNFSTMTTTAATGNNGSSAVYVITDTKPVEGYNYYRVTSVDINGKTSTTSVVKVFIGALAHNITIYPNPITDGMIHLQLVNEPAGRYNIRLYNHLGQLITQKEITHAGGNATELIKWNYNLAHGMYKLEVIQPDNSVKLINVMY